jgi:hypothetical protein
MLIGIPPFLSCSVKTQPVPNAPWSVLKISGYPQVSTCSRAFSQNGTSREIDSAHHSTNRLKQSIITAR